jgi:hypothetical protein
MFHHGAGSTRVGDSKLLFFCCLSCLVARFFHPLHLWGSWRSRSEVEAKTFFSQNKHGKFLANNEPEPSGKLVRVLRAENYLLDRCRCRFFRAESFYPNRAGSKKSSIWQLASQWSEQANWHEDNLISIRVEMLQL